jgi:DNA-binding NtrC family response regulator
MGDARETVDGRSLVDGAGAPRRPGIVVVFCGSEPMCHVFPLSGMLRLGRDSLDGKLSADDRLSREHVELGHDGAWTIRDLGSKNGTLLDGKLVADTTTAMGDHVVRIARTLILLKDDVTPLLGGYVENEPGRIVGPTLRGALDQIGKFASSGESLHIHGESGAGKELAARTFHRRGPASNGPFVAVNCATILETVAERLLFGARRGAFSGATDAKGYIEAADGGVLFLDEIGELSLEVQAKLLRVLETREVTPLGATAGRKVSLRLCTATHRDLRQAVAARRFRADLYYRIGRPEVVLPSLRERPEEIPWLVVQEIRNASPAAVAHVALVEAALMRPWPGNVRELLGAIRQAAQVGGEIVRVEDLDPKAGFALAVSPESVAEQSPHPPAGPEQLKRQLEEVERQRIIAALDECGGNQTRAAKVLGISLRTLVNRLDEFGIARPRKK